MWISCTFRSIYQNNNIPCKCWSFRFIEVCWIHILIYSCLTGGTQTLFCVEVGEKDKVGPGGGLVEEGEMINVVEMTVSEAKEYISRQDSQNQDGQLKI